ncbi:hypothetical protein AGABI1DRAFT_32971 [Agaricus bisporus var. burnettii JB137-S8]|uniref:Uncharacterized protein n=1 Tax=Agaricus bisporus var. burnettii (strain JB137-S8 / ATCC MYA-4627 / FGSC 10392) TaxID=597362 RepID=K5Y5Q0_AGABU|nr:uncharacterized protein AGABI1DRAFT_32971 [Agaricus bisporus var. burnettii JB137-S8]EKM83445.1 hypothetical protein AGABI1DRAFT_32971 [Agaricus bisporus var. burnettii JB137-S8]
MSAEENQVEHEQIATSLEVETIEVNLFRSKSLWLPFRSRGVFGGQVISQGLVSATKCVDPQFSLHCYFLTSASSSTPIVYEVERIRNGRSYVTRAVKAIQNGRIVFVMMCSFQKPETWQPGHQWPMPTVPQPEECQLEESQYIMMAERADLHPKLAEFYKLAAAERARSPIEIRIAKEDDIAEDGTVRYMYWMKARNIPNYDPPFQRCILSYLSDMKFIMTAARTLGLKRNSQGPDALGMVSTLDHTIWFYK